MTKLRIANHPVIAAVREIQHLPVAIDSPVQMIFLMSGDALTVCDAVHQTHRAGKQIVVHIDLMKGITPDKFGVQYLARTAGPDAIVSTKLHVLQAARKEGLDAILHLFVIDTQAYHTGLRHAQQFRPDAIELMPGLMPRVIGDLDRAIDAPVIAAGLIQTFAEVKQAIDSGAASTVVGARELWSLRLQ